MATALFEAGAHDVLYIVDLSGYVFRAYHAIAPLTSPTGEPTHAVLGTVNMLEKMVRQRQPTLLAIAMDSSKRNFRKDVYPEYKANRPPQPEDLGHQMRRCREIVDAFNIPCFQCDGLEADDLIAAAVAQARAHSLRVVIVSADKDLMQLVGDDVLLWDTMRDRVIGPAEVAERFGVGPEQLRDLLALCGDTSDNVPGVPSIGPKTARDLLVAYGSMDGIYAHLDDITKKGPREALRANREQAFVSRDLVTLRADAQVDFDPERLAYGGRDVARLRQIYEELGFQRQLAALPADGAADAPAPALAAQGGGAKPARHPASAAPPVETTHTLVTDGAVLAAVVQDALAAGRVAIVPELSVDEPMRAALIGLSICARAEQSYYVPIAHRYVGAPKQLSQAAVLEAIAGLLASEAVRKVTYDGKQLDVALRRAGTALGAPVFDAELAAYLLDPQAPNRLEDLAQGELAVALSPREAITKRGRGKAIAFEEVAVEEALPYAAPRAAALLRLEERLVTRLAEENLTGVFDSIEMPLASLLADMEVRGVLVDVAGLGKLGERMDKELTQLEHKAHAVAGKAFNVHSPRQLETILFDELELKPLRRTKTSRSTDADTLEALSEEHDLPAVILEIRQISKLKGTYVDALPALVNKDTGRIHTRWAQAVAATGRISSQDPNLQNIPIRTELGRTIRAAFIAPPGHQLVSADYSQIELRVLAHLSEDPVLVDSFQSNQDIHTRTAMEIFGLSQADVTPEHRRRAKAVNFGVIYGQGDSGLAKSLGISRAEAGSFIAAYFRRYKGVQRFMEETLSRARAGESVSSLFGRRRMVPDIGSSNRARRLAAERIAMNMPIQGTAADLLKMAMLALREPVTKGARMVLTVHDELVFEVPDAEVETARPLIQRAMEGVYALRVPLVVEVGHGPTWAEAH